MITSCTAEAEPAFDAASARTASDGGHDTSSKTLTDWVTAINHFLACDRTTTIELARLMYGAKQMLRYGQWTAMWRAGQIHFSKRKGEMLVVIGKNLGQLDAQNSAQLPPAWNTLYYLAQLDRPILESFICDGTVGPRLTLQAARQLLEEFKGRRRKGSKANVTHRLQRLRNFVFSTVQNWSLAQREFAYAELLDLAQQIALREPKLRPVQEVDLHRTETAKTLSATNRLSLPTRSPSLATIFVN